MIFCLPKAVSVKLEKTVEKIKGVRIPCFEQLSAGPFQ